MSLIKAISIGWSGRLALNRGSGASSQSRRSFLQYEYATFNHSSPMGSPQEINGPRMRASPANRASPPQPRNDWGAGFRPRPGPTMALLSARRADSSATPGTAGTAPRGPRGAGG